MIVRKRLIAAFALALVCSVLQLTVLPTSASACVLDVIAVESIRVDIASAEKAYRAGDVAEIRFAVSRPGREDAVGLGLALASPVSSPAAGLEVGVFITLADEFVYAFGDPTDEQGRSSAKVEVPPVPAGVSAEVLAVAWKTQVQGPCFIVVEQGTIEVERAFRIAK